MSNPTQFKQKTAEEKEIDQQKFQKLEDFLTREQKVELLHDIPQTTEKCIIVLPKQDALGFKINYNKYKHIDEYASSVKNLILKPVNIEDLHSPNFQMKSSFLGEGQQQSEDMQDILVSQHIGLDKFYTTITKANKICELVWQQKKRQETIEPYKNLKYLLYFAGFLSLIAIILLIILVYYEDGVNDNLLYSSVGFIVLAGVIQLGVVFRSIFTKYETIILEDQIMKELITFFKNENINTYNQKNLVWKIGRQFFWLELHICSNLLEVQQKMEQYYPEK